MEFDAIVERLKAQWPAVDAPKVEAGDRVCIIPAEQNLEILGYLRDEPDLYFDSLMSLAGADTGRELWVVYPLHSLRHLHKLLVKAVLPRENPEITSVVEIWKMAEFFEREAYDLYGINFKSHPDLRRIMNPPDWEGWPGRKDYEYPIDYQGIPTLRADQFFEDAITRGTNSRQNQEKEIVAKAQAEFTAKQAAEKKP